MMEPSGEGSAENSWASGLSAAAPEAELAVVTADEDAVEACCWVCVVLTVDAVSRLSLFRPRGLKSSLSSGALPFCILDDGGRPSARANLDELLTLPPGLTRASDFAAVMADIVTVVGCGSEPEGIGRTDCWSAMMCFC